VREEVTEQRFSEILGQLTFDEEALACVRDALRVSHADEKREYEEAIGRLRVECDRLQSSMHAMYVSTGTRGYVSR
jgi:site-specific DNA recombinase